MRSCDEGRRDAGAAVSKVARGCHFGRRAESLPVNQLLLGLEEAQPIKAESARSGCTNRGALPEHLSQIEQIIDVQDDTSACCQGALDVMSENVSERLDIVLPQIRVIVTLRPKCACEAQAPAATRLIECGRREGAQNAGLP